MEVLVLKHFERPTEEGVYLRLVCLQGQLQGRAYFFNQRIVLGRGRTCQVILPDIKASREHAEIVPVGNQVVISDLGSQNGIFVNQIKVKQHPLKENDKILIGQTLFKYNQVDINHEDQVDLSADPKKGKKSLLFPLLIIGGLVALFSMVDEGEQSKQNGKIKKFYEQKITENNERENLNEEQKIKLEAIFQRGLREFREGNYFRAISEFNLALVISPKDSLASFYLKKSKDALDKEIQKTFFKAQRDFESLKYNSSQNSYCSIIRLLNKYPEDQRYIKAEKQLRKIEEKLGKEKDEIACF